MTSRHASPTPQRAAGTAINPPHADPVPLGQGEAFFRAILESPGAGFLFTDADDRILHANATTDETAGACSDPADDWLA